MKRSVIIVAASLVTTLGIWWAPQLLAALRERANAERPAVAYLGSAAKLEAGYRQWRTDHEANGGDRNVSLALRWSRGLSVEYSKATGQAHLDLVQGRVRVEVQGLEGPDWQVWLVDNEPGPGRSVAPEPGDRLIRVGALQRQGDVARLDTRLDARALQAFELDLIVVARPGNELGKRGVLFGAPGLYQRLYTRARTGYPTVEQAALPRLVAWMNPVAHAAATVASLDPLVVKGADLFFNERFRGNGRTCGTCHPAENNFTIDPKFIATLPPTDPLFVAEFTPALSKHFENPKLMRQFGLIQENLDGFDDLANKFVMRSVPHIFALNVTMTPAKDGADGTTTPPNERTGWGGDGAPGSGTLREFAIGAVTQHFPRSLGRKAGTDFRLPTDEELDALEAFQRFVGRDKDPDLSTLKLKGAIPRRGKEIFLATDTKNGTVVAGKCQTCHSNGGATVNFAPGVNFNFATGVEALIDPPADLVDPTRNPPDGGFGTAKVDGVPGFGNGTFNTPSLIEAADTGPFFHNNALVTIEDAVNFFNSVAFEKSPAGQFLASIDTGKIGIALEPTHVQAVAGFLRVLNALENIRAAHEMQAFVLEVGNDAVARTLLRLAAKDQQDAIEVLTGAHLHPLAALHLRKAMDRTRLAAETPGRLARNALIRLAMVDQEIARKDMVE